MRRWSAGTLVVLLVAAVAASPARAVVGIVGSLVPVTVTPTAPGPRSTVTVSFTLPSTTGDPTPESPAVAERHLDAVVISGPRRSGCASAGSVRTPAATAGATLHIRLRPGTLGASQWCTGRYTGDVTESTMPDCTVKKHQMCPMYAVVPQIIGKFHFTVAAR